LVLESRRRSNQNLSILYRRQ